MSVLLALALVAILALAIAGCVAWVRLRRSAGILARMAPALAEAPEFFALIDRSVPRSHFLERHGPLLNRMDVHQRAQTGEIPFSQHQGRPVDATRWFRHEDLLRAVDSALTHWDAGVRPKGGAFHFIFDHAIGEGFEKGSDERTETTVARVIVRQGDVITAYPVLHPIGSAHRHDLQRSDESNGGGGDRQ